MTATTSSHQSSSRKSNGPGLKLHPESPGGGERAGQQQRQKRPKAAGRAEAGAETDVEEDSVHAGGLV